MKLYDKFDNLKVSLKEMGRVAVAFSGGVDSTFLLKTAYEVLKNNALAITAKSAFIPEREILDSIKIVEMLGVRHVFIDFDVMSIKVLVENPENRCYICKKEVFSRISEEARKNNIEYVLDGSNIDDLGDYRPGMAALQELGIISPLRNAGMTKEDIRILSKELGLPTWDKPAFACLASRFPYGHQITPQKLNMVEEAEQFLADQGFRQFRVRHHGDIARIEVEESERSRFFNVYKMERVHDELRKIGFKYVALDLKGYRMGSLNEGIVRKD
jgi:uncharacterized protein